jgi:hypothetical protein
VRQMPTGSSHRCGGLWKPKWGVRGQTEGQTLGFELRALRLHEARTSSGAVTLELDVEGRGRAPQEE